MLYRSFYIPTARFSSAFGRFVLVDVVVIQTFDTDMHIG